MLFMIMTRRACRRVKPELMPCSKNPSIFFSFFSFFLAQANQAFSFDPAITGRAVYYIITFFNRWLADPSQQCKHHPRSTATLDSHDL
jgi:hypothetical protein